jgi:hypothetical protein
MSSDVLILKDKNVLLLEATDSYRRVNLLLNHLLFAIHIINSTDGYAPLFPINRWFFKFTNPINGDLSQHTHTNMPS